jgi:hypothetical protein
MSDRSAAADLSELRGRVGRLMLFAIAATDRGDLAVFHEALEPAADALAELNEAREREQGSD